MDAIGLASLFVGFRAPGLLSCHFKFSFLPVGCSCLSLKSYLVAGILTFTDRSPRYWGLSRPPRLASKTDPHIHPSEGHPIPLSSVTWNQLLSRTVSCIISCFSCSAWSLQQIHSFLSTELWSVLSIPSMAKPATAGTSKHHYHCHFTSVLNFFSKIDFSYLLCIPLLLLSSISC